MDPIKCLAHFDLYLKCQTIHISTEIEDILALYDSSNTYDKCIEDTGLQEILNGDITIEEIVEAVKKINPGKAPSQDKFPIEFVKQIIHIYNYGVHK